MGPEYLRMTFQRHQTAVPRKPLGTGMTVPAQRYIKKWNVFRWVGCLNQIQKLLHKIPISDSCSTTRNRQPFKFTDRNWRPFEKWRSTRWKEAQWVGSEPFLHQPETNETKRSYLNRCCRRQNVGLFIVIIIATAVDGSNTSLMHMANIRIQDEDWRNNSSRSLLQLEKAGGAKVKGIRVTNTTQESLPTSLRLHHPFVWINSFYPLGSWIIKMSRFDSFLPTRLEPPVVQLWWLWSILWWRFVPNVANFLIHSTFLISLQNSIHNYACTIRRLSTMNMKTALSSFYCN